MNHIQDIKLVILKVNMGSLNDNLIVMELLETPSCSSDSAGEDELMTFVLNTAAGPQPDPKIGNFITAQVNNYSDQKVSCNEASSK